MKKLLIILSFLSILFSVSLFAKPSKKIPEKPFEPRYINPLQEVNIVGDVFVKGKGPRRQIFLKDELGEIYTLKVDDAYSSLYYEDLFIYDGYTVRIVGTLDTRTSVIEVRLIRIREVPKPKKKSPPPPKKAPKPPVKEEVKPPKKNNTHQEPLPPKKESVPPKKNDAPKPPKK